VNAQSRGFSVVPTSLVVRALTVAAWVTLALTSAACGPYYPGPATSQPQPQTRTQPQPQTQVQGAAVTLSPARRDLEARAAQLERDPRRRAEASAIRARLRDGDFRVGDAIVINVVNVPQMSDTFPVRAGLTMQLPEVAPIPLAGVLRSELQPHLRRHIARYVIDPTVEAHSLVRVAVAGAVQRPGFYELRPDAPVSEIVMAAGGLASQGDVTKMSVRRAGRVIMPETAVRTAIAMGATLDDMNVRPGDELRIGERPTRNWLEVARTAAYVAVVATGLWAAGRR
jgi:protein involved in polysaccharide export with SLBB domain